MHSSAGDLLDDKIVPNLGTKMGLRMEVPAQLDRVRVSIKNPAYFYVHKWVDIASNMVNSVSIDRVPDPLYDPSSSVSPEMQELDNYIKTRLS